MESRIFLKAIADLRKAWFGELIAEASPLKRDELVFKMRALEAIPLQLTHYVNDELQAQKRGQR